MLHKDFTLFFENLSPDKVSLSVQVRIIQYCYIFARKLSNGRVAEWLKATDCKSVEIFLRRFESYLSQLFLYKIQYKR